MKKQLPNILLCIVPFVMALIAFPSLPDIIPIHFDQHGIPNDFGSKYMIFIGAALPLFVWIIFLAIPKIDPKSTIEQMGDKYDYFVLANVLLMSILGCFMIHSMQSNEIKLDVKWIFIIVAALLMIVGNYMPAMKPNYFMGIRNPWTLENEIVWKKTHQIGGKLFFALGFIVFVMSLIESIQIYISSVLLIGTLSIVVITSVYSYRLYKLK